ncbi:MULTISPECIES: glycosyltransferase family 41 protein [Oxalobacteraceae]|uniref:tetratricopeptide repeat protein n=1 Tax=Herminiimonas sp. Marseille-P9896 TaxID=2742211 RepID=UPI0015893D1C|nr:MULTISPECIES: glycosyltransferase family 41 protein [Oxalobacteraceae]
MNTEKYKSNFQLANSFYEKNDLDAAKKILIQLSVEMPTDPHVFRLLGFIFGRQGDFFKAAEYLARLMQLEPGFIEGWYYLGKAWYEIEKFDEAIKCFDTAIGLYPNFFEAHHDKARALCSLRRLNEATQAFEIAYKLNPNSAELWTNLGWVFVQLRQFEKVIVCCSQVLRLQPKDAMALRAKGDAHFSLQQYQQAIAEYEKVLVIDADFEGARGSLLYAKFMSADWSNLDHHYELMKTSIRNGKKCVTPFVMAILSNSPQEQSLATKRYTADLYPPAKMAPRKDGSKPNERIRLAYLSADYHQHATAFLMLELFKRHDRKRFDVIAISYGPDDGSQTRKELETSFDEFIDVQGKSDRQIAELLSELKIDIAIDLKGYTDDGRPGIFTYGATPIQVSYLGYPGTMGAEYFDYLIADRFLITPEDEDLYSESIVYMPDSYQVNGRNREIHQPLPTRADCGLPEQGFVFCSFNNTYKNNPTVFSVWMSLLKRVEGSVLWLLTKTGNFEDNICNEAIKRGVDPKRIIFAKNMPLPQHLARVTLSDLFLDSLPCNAHTTASDALWANVPVVTCVGTTFAGRVGQSVLNAIDMPELVTHTLAGYEQLAFELATDKNALSAVREKLRHKIQASPLFDADRFAHHLEWAYEEMLRRYKNGEDSARMNVPKKS